MTTLLTVAAGTVLVAALGRAGTSRWWIATWAGVHTVACLALLGWPTVLADPWWQEVQRPWGPAPLSDQRQAALVALVVGLLAAGILTVRRRSSAPPTTPARPLVQPLPSPGAR